MKNNLLKLLFVCSLFLVCSPLMAQDAKVTSLMSKPLSDIPGLHWRPWPHKRAVAHTDEI